ncbi:cache domain-containing sensor histidine kinase [Cohnella sp. JJ-181]|uniref:cache domain-containing sensor histidine kinase n=1 Tax=Cohnella rhizoplanae TaxID=2974897 RepID=UPI0022FF7007|nr:sensor histidine kinase [Cohnella sp. JJ-181]CAI6083036.1 hypothetical protein COHCIP112018_03850 [Cohnella sp. JJ-181]
MTLWFKQSLKSKLSLLILVAVIAPLLATGVVSYRIASNLTEKIEKESGMNTLRQVSDKLDFLIRDAETMSVFIIGQKDIQTYLDRGDADYALYSQNVAFLMNLASSKTYISNITITSTRGHPALSNTTVVHSGLPELQTAAPRSHDPDVKWWTPPYENRTTDDGVAEVFSLVRPIRDMSKFKRIGELAISIDISEVRRMLQDAGWNAGGQIWLINRDNRIVASPAADDEATESRPPLPDVARLTGPEGVMNVSDGRESNTLLYYTLPGLEWKLVGVIPTKIYTAQNKYVLTLTAYAIGLAALLAVVLVLYFITWVTRPLAKISKKLKDINPDEPVTRIEVKSSDEIGMLLHSYNKLGDRIQRLKSQLQEHEAKKKEVDIQALQAQIHPHFLYNTLSSIQWNALMNKDRQTAEMVGALSDFLRFSLNDGKEFCTVQQEVSHAQNYIRIMSRRFQDKFDSAFFIDPALHSRPMLKLLLQPLIENSIMHGLQKQKKKGSLFVFGECRDGAMTFVVEDTGLGMDADKLLKLRRDLAAPDDPEEDRAAAGKSGYGLRSVHRRLQLHYGGVAGLRIDSDPGIRTRISFQIPIPIEEVGS